MPRPRRTRSWRWLTPPSTSCDTGRGRRRAGSYGPTRSSTAPPSPTSTAPRTTRPARCGSTTRARPCWRPPPTSIGAKIVHPSSDYVFDGSRRVPYVESDMPAPISAYGRSKQAGETSVAVANPRHFIVRASWLFGLGGKNFVETMLRLGGEQPEVLVVSDQVGCPTYTRHLGEALAAAGGGRGVRDPPHRRRRAVLLVRVRAGDLRPGRRRVPGDGRDDRDAGPQGAAPRVLGAGQRAPRPDRAAALAAGPGRVPAPSDSVAEAAA